MKYVYAGPYKEFRGYVFANGKPVTILDKGTLSAIAREPGFREVHEEEKAETAPQVLTHLAKPEFSCPKCGKELKPQGRHFHIRACR